MNDRLGSGMRKMEWYQTTHTFNLQFGRWWLMIGFKLMCILIYKIIMK
jgi:hypothetical protein